MGKLVYKKSVYRSLLVRFLREYIVKYICIFTRFIEPKMTRLLIASHFVQT